MQYMKSKRIDCDLPPSFWCPYPMPEAMALAALRVLSLCEKQLFKSMAIYSACDCWKQLCKRMAGLIPHSWSNMVWKRVSPMDVVAWGQFSHSPVCVLSFFGMVTPKQPNNRVILEQACSWPVRRQSFAISQHLEHLGWRIYCLDSVTMEFSRTLPLNILTNWSMHAMPWSPFTKGVEALWPEQPEDEEVL